MVYKTLAAALCAAIIINHACAVSSRQLLASAPKRAPSSPKVASNRQLPGFKPKSVPPVKQQPPLCNARFKSGQQCGGAGGGCTKYPFAVGNRCPDSYWNQGCCPAGQSCQRSNKWFWSCKKTNVEVPPSLPPLSKLPPNHTLPKPVIVNSKVIVNGKPKHQYLLLKYLADWFTAEAICQKYYGLHLASIHDIGELWRLNNRCFAQMRDMCWVGANDLRRRGIFRWTDGSSWDWQWWQQNDGISATSKHRCIALQDAFQTWPCNTKWAIACQVY